MEFVGLLAPIAFIFAMSAYSQIAPLKKEVEKIKAELAQLKAGKGES